MPRLAVIQSVYKNDRPEYLKLSIDSILNQSFSDFLYLIGIDGPIDNDLLEVLNNYTDRRIRIVINEKNKGLAFILNELLLICMEEGIPYIARMDSDDISIVNRFEKQISFLEQHSEVDILGGAINEIDEYGSDKSKIINYPCNSHSCRTFFSKRNPVAHPTVMFRRSFFDKVKCLYPIDFVRNEDTGLWYEGFKNGAVFANLPDVILNFRVTEQMFSQRRNGKKFALSQLNLRKKINRDLGFGFMANIYAYAMYLLMISPVWLIKLAYRLLR